MPDEAITFGQIIVRERRKRGWSQRELAAKVKREDGTPISGAYLNDIEHDRRSPSSEVVKQFAKALGLDPDYLSYLAGRFSEDRRLQGLPQEKFVEGMMAFRKEVLNKK